MFSTLTLPVTDESLALREPTATLSPVAAEQKTQAQPEPDSGSARAIVLRHERVMRSGPRGNGLIISPNEVGSIPELFQIHRAEGGFAIRCREEVKGCSPFAIRERLSPPLQCPTLCHSPTYHSAVDESATLGPEAALST